MEGEQKETLHADSDASRTQEKPIKFTIVTVTYNAGKTLQRTLDSIAEQDYPHVEHLIIDGCSTDRTMELIHLYVDANTGKTIPHDIQMIREPDKGLYDAMNKGLTNAHGDYICFLNAGDKLHRSDTLRQMARIIQNEKRGIPAVVYGETDLVDDKGHFIRHRRLQSPQRLSWHSFKWGMLVCHQSFYIHRSMATRVSYELKYRFSSDFDWCIRILKLASRQKRPITNTGMILTDYLHEGLTTTHHQESLRERLYIMAKHYSWPMALALHGWFVIRSVIKK